MMLTGATEEQRLEALISRVLHNKNSPTGHTRNLFVKRFRLLERDMDPTQLLPHTRSFIDGMHAYVMKNHAAEFLPHMIDVKDETVDIRSHTTEMLSDSSRLRGCTSSKPSSPA